MTMRRLQLIEEGGAPPPPEPGTARLRIAVATHDGKALDAHFGAAPRFAVYEVSPASSRLVEMLAFDTVSDGNGTHAPEGDDRLGPKVAALAGCNLLFVLAIGGPAAARVVAARIHPVKMAAPEPIDSILARVQALMKGNPPPWLRKAMSAARAPTAEDLERDS